MKIKTTLILIAFGAAIASCSEEKNTETEKTEPKEEVVETDARWEVNPEMMPHIEKAEELLASYVENASNDFTALGDTLKYQTNQLIKSCTMKGDAHDVLHSWLHPHIDLTNELRSTSDTSRAEELVADLKSSFADFHQRFK